VLVHRQAEADDHYGDQRDGSGEQGHDTAETQLLQPRVDRGSDGGRLTVAGEWRGGDSAVSTCTRACVVLAHHNPAQ
jgi:hypothetical protein